MFYRSAQVVLFLLLGNLAHADTLPMPDATRGELLYSLHCIACHTTQIHWRDKQLVTDQASLQSEVNRWQELAGLGWTESDVAEVASYLNASHYHY